ncbi:MAG: YCF48-related protein [Ignavibacteriae bacterium]|nr:YCF48-related protein [Ignavibacteriota bacterium]
MKNHFSVGLIFFLFITANYSPSQTGWVTQSVPTGTYSLTSVYPVNQNVCFATAEYSISTENYYAIYKTTNSGDNWLQVSSGSGWFLKNIKFVDSLTGFVCGGLNRLYMTENQYGKCVFKTTNGGQNWNVVFNLISIPGSEMEINDMCFLNASTGWVSSRDGSVLKTTNGGINFAAYYTIPVFKKSAVSFSGNMNGWVVGDSGRVAYTVNGGVNWTVLNKLTTNHFKSVVFLNLYTGYLCGNNGNIYKSTDAGLNWTLQISGVSANLNSVYFLNPDTGWVAGINTVLKTTNGGLNWINQYSSTTSLNSVRFLNSQMGWACGGNKMLYTNSGGVVNVKEISSLKPSAYKLYNNYPNPFNPSTRIRIDVTVENPAILKVYDNLGREVITLLDKAMKPGTYEIEFNASNLSSGIYYYNLSSPNYSSTKPMVLIK